jgi:oligoendopeptidase F
MLAALPTDATDFLHWDWSKIEPYYQELAARPLDASNVEAWLRDWTRLNELVVETESRLYVAMTVNTADEAAEAAYNRYLETIQPPMLAAENTLKQKLLDSGLIPANFDIPLRNMRAEAELFREANLPLLTETKKLGAEYMKIIGSMTVQWDGEELPLPRLAPVQLENDRARREAAWRLGSERRLQDRETLNEIWIKLFQVRQQIAENAGFANYRDYTWKEKFRFDYTPDDCLSFHQAIEQAVVPAASRLLEKRRQKLGLDTLRPWDQLVDPEGRAALRPFERADQLINTTAAIFNRVDPKLGEYFDMMVEENLLDLESRKGKAPGGYCTEFSAAHRPFIFMNAVGIHQDVTVLIHEGGHSFHVFETEDLPYVQQRMGGITAEFAEVASMAMELLASPYLAQSQGGFYSDADAARARIEHLEGIILFWPYMAIIDAFQHWAYTHPAEAVIPARCDDTMQALWARFRPGLDWSGLDDVARSWWQRQLHIFEVPFYYVEYGLAQLGAVQVFGNALRDQAGAVAQYRRALALGGTAAIPELFKAAGAKFAFDADTLGAAVKLIEQTIAQLERAN